MKITLLTPGVSPYVMGGMQRHSFNLAKHLAQLGVSIDLYHTDFGNAQDIDALEGMTGAEKENINSIAIPWPKSDHLPGHYVRELKQFSVEAYRHYQKRLVPDFIIAKSLTAWSFLLAKRSGENLPPIAVNLHGFEMFQAPANIKASVENWLLRPDFYRHSQDADYLFSYGGRITELIHEKLSISNQKIIEIPGGIDPNWIAEYTETATSPIRFVFLGRYERRKGIEELQAAIQANPSWQNCAKFRFIGPIPEDKQLSLSHVSYAGPINDDALLKCELRQSDVLLCPSHSEGMPNVILEGMASGLAVVGTDVGAVRLLVDEKNGILLPKANTMEIVQAINCILNLESAELSALKSKSLERVRSYTWNCIAEKTLNHIRTAVNA